MLGGVRELEVAREAAADSADGEKERPVDDGAKSGLNDQKDQRIS